MNWEERIIRAGAPGPLTVEGLPAIIAEVKDDPPRTAPPGGSRAQTAAPKPPAAADNARVDEMSDGSLPASDPPSTWTW